jgi:hypothetical protein
VRVLHGVAPTCLGYGRSTPSTAANQQIEAQAKDLGINMVTLIRKHLGIKATTIFVPMSNKQRKAVLLGVCDVQAGALRRGRVYMPNLDANRNRALAGLIREHARLICDLTAANF